jgi:NADH dehydrogenase
MAWAAWLMIHLIFLVGFRNKISVLFQWFYSYITYKRGARIITNVMGRETGDASKAAREQRQKPA